MKRVLLSLVVFVSATAVAEEVLSDDLQSLATPAEGDPFSIEAAGRLTVTVSHAFARAEAVARLSYLLAYWKKRFQVTNEWRGDRVFVSGSVYGIQIQAMFAINDTRIVGFAHDPGWPWRGQVQSYVDRKLKKYLSPTYDDP